MSTINCMDLAMLKGLDPRDEITDGQISFGLGAIDDPNIVTPSSCCGGFWGIVSLLCGGYIMVPGCGGPGAANSEEVESLEDVIL